jgi:cation transport regulator ChaC
MTGHVWYVAYGSNMSAARFRCYVEGGRPPGALREYAGCRDRTLPVESRAMFVPGRVYFALESATWTGGMAFYDPDAEGYAAARAWLITEQQFADVLSQEMHRDIGDEIDFTAVRPGVRLTVGPGRYETVVHIGDLDGRAELTFTCPWRANEVHHVPPSAAYLRMLASGLSETHGWDEAQAIAHLLP